MFNKLFRFLNGDSEIKHYVIMEEYFENDFKTICRCGCGLKIEDLPDGELFEIK